MPKAIFLTTTKAGDLLPESVPYLPNRPGSYRQLIIRLCNSHCLKLAEHSMVLLQVSCFSARVAISSAHSSASLCYLIQASQGFSLIGSAAFCPQSAWFYSWVPSEYDWIWKLWCQSYSSVRQRYSSKISTIRGSFCGYWRHISASFWSLHCASEKLEETLNYTRAM